MVRSWTGWKRLSVNWSRRQDLPTPVSPMMIYLKRYAYDILWKSFFKYLRREARGRTQTGNRGKWRKWWHFSRTSRNVADFSTELQKLRSAHTRIDRSWGAAIGWSGGEWKMPSWKLAPKGLWWGEGRRTYSSSCLSNPFHMQFMNSAQGVSSVHWKTIHLWFKDFFTLWELHQLILLLCKWSVLERPMTDLHKRI